MSSREPITAFFNFHKVLETNSARACFRQFLTQLHSTEQLDFLDLVASLKRIPQSQVQQQEQLSLNLLDTFVRVGSMREINVDLQMRQTCELAFQNIQQQQKEQNNNAGEDESQQQQQQQQQLHYHSAFRELEYQIVFQLKTDMFDMFLQSTLFEMFIGRYALEKFPSLAVEQQQQQHKSDDTDSGDGGSEDSNYTVIRSPRRYSYSDNRSLDKGSSTPEAGSPNKLMSSFVSRMKRFSMATKHQHQENSVQDSKVMIEQMNSTIKDLYGRIVEKEKEITVLRRQLAENRIVPHGIEYYHDTSGASGAIRPISARLLPPPSIKPHNHQHGAVPLSSSPTTSKSRKFSVRSPVHPKQTVVPVVNTNTSNDTSSNEVTNSCDAEQNETNQHVE